MEIMDFAKTISNMNGTAYIVGGFVRDEIMGLNPHDIDIMLVGISESDFIRQFPQAIKTGKGFPVFRIILSGEEIEIAFARKEKKVSTGHNGFVVNFAPSVTLMDDVIRRDTTMNSIAKNIITGEIIDIFGGINDIRNKVIKHVSEHFIEDSVRSLRAARQAAKFNFIIASDTIVMMNKCKEELIHETKERIMDELIKALQTSKPSIFFRWLQKANILDVCFPEIFVLNKESFEHSMKVLDIVAKKTYNIITRFCALVHELSINDIKSMPNVVMSDWKNAAKFVVTHHIKDTMEFSEIVDMFDALRRTKISMDDFIMIVEADSTLKAPWFLNNTVFNTVMGKFELPDGIDRFDIKDC